MFMDKKAEILMTLEDHEPVITIEWCARGVLILDGIAYERYIGDIDRLPHTKMLRGELLAGSCKVVPTVELQTVGRLIEPDQEGS